MDRPASSSLRLRCLRPTPKPANFCGLPESNRGGGLVILGGSSAEYTAEALRRNVSGRVVLTAELNCDGTIGRVLVEEGLPFGLSEAALESVKALKFEMSSDLVRYEKLIYDFDPKKGYGILR